MENILQTDILVAGAGPGGFAAALGAARCGAKVLLVERYGFPGGMLSAGLVNPFQPSKVNGELLTAGIFAEVVERLKEKDSILEGELFGQPFISFDAEIFKLVLFEMLAEAKVKLLFHTLATGVVMDKNCLKGIMVENKSGNYKILAKVTVDATGDADLCFWAGAPFEKDKNMQPMTFMFKIGGIDRSKMPSREEIDSLFLKANLKVPRDKLLWFESTRSDQIHINTTRISGDGTKAEDLIQGEVEGRRQMQEIIGFLKSQVPGFEKAYLVASAPQVGVRETRRIKGKYTLTEEDILSGRKFEDQIALGNFPIDIHQAKGKGTIWKPLPEGICYGIPYRCLIPQKVENLIVAGRPISVSHEAFSSTRVSPTCMAVGQAAGVAAALGMKNVKLSKLQSILKEQNAKI